MPGISQPGDFHWAITVSLVSLEIDNAQLLSCCFSFVETTDNFERPGPETIMILLWCLSVVRKSLFAFYFVKGNFLPFPLTCFLFFSFLSVFCFAFKGRHIKKWLLKFWNWKLRAPFRELTILLGGSYWLNLKWKWVAGCVLRVLLLVECAVMLPERTGQPLPNALKWSCCSRYTNNAISFFPEVKLSQLLYGLLPGALEPGEI